MAEMPSRPSSPSTSLAVRHVLEPLCQIIQEIFIEFLEYCKAASHFGLDNKMAMKESCSWISRSTEVLRSELHEHSRIETEGRASVGTGDVCCSVQALECGVDKWKFLSPVLKRPRL